MSIFRRSRRCEPMPGRFNELAAYNSRVSKGIAHTPEYAERMAILQADFNQWSREASEREGIITATHQGQPADPRRSTP